MYRKYTKWQEVLHEIKHSEGKRYTDIQSISDKGNKNRILEFLMVNDYIKKHGEKYRSTFRGTVLTDALISDSTKWVK